MKGSTEVQLRFLFLNDTDDTIIVPIQVNHEDDEPEMASDEEEYLIEHEHLPGDHSFGADDAFINSTLRDGFLLRRSRGNGT